MHGCTLNPICFVSILCTSTVPKANQLDLHQLLPPGLIILENFITSDEEETLINLIESAKLDGSECNATLKHRQVKHFGYEFRYGTNDVDVDKPLLDEPIPNECDFLWHRLHDRKPSMLEETSRPQQLTVNTYEPGHGNLSHTYIFN